MNRLAAVALSLSASSWHSSCFGGHRSTAARALHFVGEPGSGRAARRFSCAQRGLRVADDADVHRVNLADLLRIDVDLNQLASAESQRCAPGRHELQSASPNAGADGEDHVGAAHGLVGDARAPDAGHAAGQRMILGKHALAPSASSRPASPASSASCLQLGAASDSVTPLPAKITGACARCSSCAASAMPSGAAGRAAVVGAAARHRHAAGASMCCENTSIGTSSSTAPGRAGLRDVERARHDVRQKLRHRRSATRACRPAGRCRLATHRRAAGCPGAARARGGTTACCR